MGVGGWRQCWEKPCAGCMHGLVPELSLWDHTKQPWMFQQHSHLTSWSSRTSLWWVTQVAPMSGHLWASTASQLWASYQPSVSSRFPVVRYGAVLSFPNCDFGEWFLVLINSFRNGREGTKMCHIKARKRVTLSCISLTKREPKFELFTSFSPCTFCSVWLLFCLLTPWCTSTVSVLTACVLSVSPPICACESVLNKRLFSVFYQTSQKTWYGKERRDFIFKQKLLMGFYKRCYFLTTTDAE